MQVAELADVLRLTSKVGGLRRGAPPRLRARLEGRIKAGKDTGIAKLPFRDFETNAIWLNFGSPRL